MTTAALGRGAHNRAATPHHLRLALLSLFWFGISSPLGGDSFDHAAAAALLIGGDPVKGQTLGLVLLFGRSSR